MGDDADIRLFAFWRYDLFPHVVGGEVTQMRDDGRVETREYGQGSWFRPFLLLPLQAGKAKLAELKALSAEREEALREFDRAFVERRKAIVEVPGREE